MWHDWLSRTEAEDKRLKIKSRRAVRKLLFFEFITTPDSFIIAQSEKQRFTNLQKRLIYD